MGAGVRISTDNGLFYEQKKMSAVLGSETPISGVFFPSWDVVMVEGQNVKER